MGWLHRQDCMPETQQHGCSGASDLSCAQQPAQGTHKCHLRQPSNAPAAALQTADPPRWLRR